MKNLHKIVLAVGIMLCIIGAATIVYADSVAGRMAGKILLQVEGNGEAWYVNPTNLQRYFLGRPNDAFALMRKLGLGISNSNLNQIPIAKDSPAVPGKQSTNATQNQESAESDTQQTAKTWKVTHTFTGNQDLTTEPFVLTNGLWIKVKYSYTPSEYSNFIIQLKNPGSALDTNLLHNDIHEVGDVVSNETNVYNKQNNYGYYFDVKADGEWKIEVSELQ